jgi:hypothetical protein
MSKDSIKKTNSKKGYYNKSICFYSNCRRVDCMVSRATDDESAKKLWELSCDLVKLEDELRI